MNTVNVATLKMKLSYYLKMVERGQEVVVTSHKQPVARILPILAASVEPMDPCRPVSDLFKLKPIRRRRAVSAVRSLIEDRRSR